MLYTFTLIILQRERLNIYLFCSLERRWSRRTFSYTCLVTTSPSLLNTPSIQPSLRLGFVSSGASNSGGVTGGVYKAREHIQRSVADLRLLATPSSRGWVSTLDPYWGWCWRLACHYWFATHCSNHCRMCVALDIRGVMIWRHPRLPLPCR